MVLSKVLRRCRKSRVQIAGEVSAMTGVSVTKGMLDDWCREGKIRLRFPLSLVWAICEITDNDELALVAMRDSLREYAELGKALHPFLKKWAEGRQRTVQTRRKK